MSGEVWESTLQGVKSYGAYGPRDVLLIVSSERLEGADIVPRRRGELSAEDKERLSSQGIPVQCWEDDVKLMEERYRREENRFNLLNMDCPGTLTCGHVRGRIHDVMKSTSKPGVVLHYIGPGKRHTGDWCFPDGFIEFRELIDAYMEYFHSESKCLEITSDCSHSGKWVLACREFLDEVGVQPCGHSARRANMLLKVRTSCQSHETPYTLLYSARGRGNDKNTGSLYVRGNGYEVEQGQHVRNIDNTVVTCKRGASHEDPCQLQQDYTWHKKGLGERVYLVRGKDKGRKCWHYVLVVDDEEILDLFHKKIKSGNIDVNDYGHVIKSGWGQDPPNDVKDWIDNKYNGIKS